MLTACGSSADQGSPSGSDTIALPVTTPAAPPPETAWEAIRDGIEGGAVDLQTALDAFALTLGPVTGAEVPAGESGFEGSASGPLRWLRGHWDELTDQQREEVEELLESYGAGSGAALPGPQWAAPVSYLAAAAPLQAAVDDAVVNLEALLGRSLTLTITVSISPVPLPDGAWALADARDAAGGSTGDATTCAIIYSPLGAQFTGNDRTYIAAHEAFHCFQADLTDLASFVKLPPWIVEGMAEWAGQTIAGESTIAEVRWEEWLSSRWFRQLFNRSYDALGFYAHLTDSGIELWSRFDQATTAGYTSSEAAYQALTASGSLEVIDSWSAGYYRDPGHVPEWDQEGPGITIHRPEIPIQDLPNETNLSFASEPFTVFMHDLDVAAEVVIVDAPDAGLAMPADGSTIRLADMHGVIYCTTGACACPDGSPGAGTVFEQLAPGTMRLASTGHVTGGAVAVYGYSLDRFCENEPCFSGEWVSTVWNVEPHFLLGGSGGELVIDKNGEGFLDFNPAAPLLGFVLAGHSQGTEMAPLKLELGGTSRFSVELSGGVGRVTAATGQLTFIPFIDLGDGWFQTGEGIIGGDHASVTPGTVFTCAGDTLLLNGVIEFSRVSTEGELPPEAAEQTPTTGAVSDDGVDPADYTGPLPDIDPCKLLTIDEVKARFPEAVAPSGPDQVPVPTFIQCSYGVLFLQVFAPTTPANFTSGSESFGIDVIEVDGIGGWALALVNQPDPELEIEDTVFNLVAGTPNGTVSIVPFFDVKLGDPDYQALLELLQLAIDRL